MEDLADLLSRITTLDDLGRISQKLLEDEKTSRTIVRGLSSSPEGVLLGREMILEKLRGVLGGLSDDEDDVFSPSLRKEKLESFVAVMDLDLFVTSGRWKGSSSNTNKFKIEGFDPHRATPSASQICLVMQRSLRQMSIHFAEEISEGGSLVVRVICKKRNPTYIVYRPGKPHFWSENEPDDVIGKAFCYALNASGFKKEFPKEEKERETADENGEDIAEEKEESGHREEERNRVAMEEEDERDFLQALLDFQVEEKFGKKVTGATEKKEEEDFDRSMSGAEIEAYYRGLFRGQASAEGASKQEKPHSAEAESSLSPRTPFSPTLSTTTTAAASSSSRSNLSERNRDSSSSIADFANSSVVGVSPSTPEPRPFDSASTTTTAPNLIPPPATSRRFGDLVLPRHCHVALALLSPSQLENGQDNVEDEEEDFHLSRSSPSDCSKKDDEEIAKKKSEERGETTSPKPSRPIIVRKSKDYDGKSLPPPPSATTRPPLKWRPTFPASILLPIQSSPRSPVRRSSVVGGCDDVGPSPSRRPISGHDASEFSADDRDGNRSRSPSVSRSRSRSSSGSSSATSSSSSRSSNDASFPIPESTSSSTRRRISESDSEPPRPSSKTRPGYYSSPDFSSDDGSRGCSPPAASQSELFTIPSSSSSRYREISPAITTTSPEHSTSRQNMVVPQTAPNYSDMYSDSDEDDDDLPFAVPRRRRLPKPGRTPPRSSSRRGRQWSDDSNLVIPDAAAAAAGGGGESDDSSEADAPLSPPPPRLNCAQCTKTFKTRDTLRNHRKTVHSTKEKRHRCKDCAFATHYSHNWKEHMDAIHNKVKPHSCPRCHFRTAYSGYVRHHVNAVHLKEKRFRCADCHFSTYWKSSFDVHCKGVHLGQKDFVCFECGRQFVTGSQLIRHQRTSHGNGEEGEEVAMEEFHSVYVKEEENEEEEL